MKVVDNRSNGGANQNTNILHSIEELEFADLTKVVSHSDSSEFNISTSGYGKYWSEITELSNCGLLASWTTDGQDGDLYGVYNQRFASDGELSGSEFRANTTTSNSQYEPSSAELNNGKTFLTVRNFNKRKATVIYYLKYPSFFKIKKPIATPSIKSCYFFLQTANFQYTNTLAIIKLTNMKKTFLLILIFIFSISV